MKNIGSILQKNGYVFFSFPIQLLSQSIELEATLDQQQQDIQIEEAAILGLGNYISTASKSIEPLNDNINRCHLNIALLNSRIKEIENKILLSKNKLCEKSKLPEKEKKMQKMKMDKLSLEVDLSSEQAKLADYKQQLTDVNMRIEVCENELQLSRETLEELKVRLGVSLLETALHSRPLSP